MVTLLACGEDSEEDHRGCQAHAADVGDVCVIDDGWRSRKGDERVANADKLQGKGATAEHSARAGPPCAQDAF